MVRKLSKKKILVNNSQAKLSNFDDLKMDPFCGQNLKVLAAEECLKKDWIWGAFLGADFAGGYTILTCHCDFLMFAYTIPLGAVLGGGLTLAVLSANYVYQKNKNEKLHERLLEQ